MGGRGRPSRPRLAAGARLAPGGARLVRRLARPPDPVGRTAESSLAPVLAPLRPDGVLAAAAAVALLARPRAGPAVALCAAVAIVDLRTPTPASTRRRRGGSSPEPPRSRRLQATAPPGCVVRLHAARRTDPAEAPRRSRRPAASSPCGAGAARDAGAAVPARAPALGVPGSFEADPFSLDSSRAPARLPARGLPRPARDHLRLLQLGAVSHVLAPVTATGSAPSRPSPRSPPSHAGRGAPPRGPRPASRARRRRAGCESPPAAAAYPVLARPRLRPGREIVLPAGAGAAGRPGIPAEAQLLAFGPDRLQVGRGSTARATSWSPRAGSRAGGRRRRRRAAGPPRERGSSARWRCPAGRHGWRWSTGRGRRRPAPSRPRRRLAALPARGLAARAGAARPGGGERGVSVERLHEHRRLWRVKPVLGLVYAPWFDALLAEAAPSGARVLEVGAGPGFLSAHAHDRRNGPALHGLRPAPAALEHRRRRRGTPSARERKRGGGGRPRRAPPLRSALAGFFREAARVLGDGRADRRSSSRGSPRCPGWSTGSSTRRTAGSPSTRGTRSRPRRTASTGDAAVPWKIVRETPREPLARARPLAAAGAPPQRLRLRAEPRLPARVAPAAAARLSGDGARPRDVSARSPHRPAGGPDLAPAVAPGPTSGARTARPGGSGRRPRGRDPRPGRPRPREA